MKKDLKSVHLDGRKGLMLSLPSGDYLYMKMLGKGGVGRVYLFCEKNDHTKLWVIKEIDITADASREEKEILSGIKENVKALIDNPPPDVSDIMVPPVEAIDFKESGTFGYRMRYVDLAEYCAVSDLFIRKDAYPGADILCSFGEKISRFFTSLNNHGLCYKDVNEGNIYLNLHNGSVQIIDNDNVGKASVHTIVGTGVYRAPEILVDGKKPDRLSDRFQLALFLFRLFTGGHPLDGKAVIRYCMDHNVSINDPGVAEVVFGSKALFVFDENDRSNALPATGEEYVRTAKLWKRLPEELKVTFRKTFSDGLSPDNRNKREPASEWLLVFNKLNQTLMPCGHRGCGYMTFGTADTCIHCGSRTSKVLCVNCGKSTPKALDDCVYCHKSRRKSMRPRSRCPICDAEVPAGTRICGHCGKYMQTKCPVCGVTVSGKEKACSNGHSGIWHVCTEPSCKMQYPASLDRCPSCKAKRNLVSTCPSCHRILPSGMGVCPQCHTPLVARASSQPGVIPSGQPPVNTGSQPITQSAPEGAWIKGKTEFAVRVLVKKESDDSVERGVLRFKLGNGNLFGYRDFQAPVEGDVFGFRADLSRKMIGIYNASSSPALLYRMVNGSPIAEGDIPSGAVGAVSEGMQLKFDHIWLYIDKIEELVKAG